MITIDVAEYCSACMDFDPDVQRPQKAYGMSEEFVISDIERYLREGDRRWRWQDWRSNAVNVLLSRPVSTATTVSQNPAIQIPTNR